MHSETIDQWQNECAKLFRNEMTAANIMNIVSLNYNILQPVIFNRCVCEFIILRIHYSIIETYNIFIQLVACLGFSQGICHQYIIYIILYYFYFFDPKMYSFITIQDKSRHFRNIWICTEKVTSIILICVYTNY